MLGKVGRSVECLQGGELLRGKEAGSLERQYGSARGIELPLEDRASTAVNDELCEHIDDTVDDEGAKAVPHRTKEREDENLQNKHSWVQHRRHREQ